MKRLYRPQFLAILAPLMVGALGACGDDSNFTQDATTANATISASVYPLSGSSPELPAAFSVTNNSFVRPLIGQFNGVVNFELAFDIRDDGKVLLLPVRKVIPFPPRPVSGAPSIGLAKSGTTFDLLTKAVTAGFVVDSTVVASAGETYLFKLLSSGCFYGEPIYGKLSIDSVLVPERRIVVRALTNRNCGGYRSLTAGIPKN